MTAFRAAFKAYRMHQVLILPRFARLTFALGLATAVFPVDAEYYFNPRFLSNDLAESVDLSAFTKGREAPPGTYRVDIYLNDEFMGGKVLMTLKYGNKSVPFGAIVTHGENKNGSIVAENGQVYLTGLPQSGKLQVSWGNDKNSNCIVDYKLPAVSPGTLLNQQTAICR
ncbi:TPA: fimbrial biogenesis outer membrane usher protein [Escherichia coli]|nr:fimbrial biogenesis outer membrane usher protein [Escherichia coli]